MAKNALQAQLLKAGLVDSKAVKKTNQQQQHQKLTGQEDDSVRRALQQAQADKAARDQQLNEARKRELDDKAVKAAVRQMLSHHQLTQTEGEVPYQFVALGKIKKIYLTQRFYDQVVAGQAWIAQLDERFVLIPKPLGLKLLERQPEVIVVQNQPTVSQNSSDEEDPYAAYVIPDDLMW